MRELYNGLRFSSFTALFLMISACLFLQGCVSSGYNTRPWEATDAQVSSPAQQSPSDLSKTQSNLDAPVNATPANNLPPVKVAILLPLSGKHERLGQAMLNAAQMALFDVGYNQFELLPKDTKGTPDGARAAARSAMQDRAELVLGPLFSPSVKAARQVTQASNVNMIAFSTDWTLANERTFLIGFLPFDQVERVVRYSASKGAKRVGVLSPMDSYGNGVVSAYQSIANNAGIETARVQRFAPKGNDLGEVMRKFSDYDARKASGNIRNVPFDSVLMPVGGAMARQVGSFLNHYDMPPASVKRLGTGLMDDPSLASDRTLSGTWFAAPAPNARQKFVRRYHNLYFVKPPRIASLAYDATALSAILAQIGLQKTGKPAYDYSSITNANGFKGVDGIFRFRKDGIVERGLAVLEYRNGKIVVVDNAPKTFQSQGY